MSLTRRHVLGGVSAAGLLSGLQAQAADDGLRTHAAANGRFFGSAVDANSVSGDKALMAQEIIECALLGGEDAFKWDTLHPGKDVYNFADGDALVKFAQKQKLGVRGHTMLWHKAMPDWLVKSLNSTNAAGLLQTHIQHVMGHFAGKMLQWDVANEVLEPADKLPGGYRDTPWFRALGPQMLDIAFNAAAQADPGALLLLNEYGLEYAWDVHKAKRERVLNLLSELKSRGVPIGGLGMQSHLEAGVPELDQNMLRQFCADVGALGFKIVITEFDVRDNRITGDVNTRDQAVAAHGRAYLDAVLDAPNVMGVVSWGLSDKHTWLNHDYPRADKQLQRALPLDDQLQRTPLWYAIAGAFDAAPKIG